MTPQVIAALSTAVVAVLGAVGALLHSIQTRRQVSAAPPPAPPSNAGTQSWPDRQV